MCKPIIATVGLFAGLGYWNDWTNGLYYITDTNKFSIQQLLNNMIKNIEFLSKNANSNINLASVGGGIPQETVRMAIAIVGLLPILIVFPFVQKYFVKGNVLVLFRGIEDCKSVVDKGIIFKQVQIGGLGSGNGRTSVVKGISIGAVKG